MRRITLIVSLIAFLILTIMAVWQHGYLGIFTQQFQNYAGVQVFVDLVIALTLFLIWLWNDAKAAGRNPIPWVLLTLATGSIGALVYLLVYKT
ncbi:MAG: DUF2834 domain-containing protein [Chloroflexi bacterium]|nr:DUF2834 domain-containing protein [Chloroflexota bacterium]MBP8056564.1 DUF2834 domain-containing protein [Chloroflexota bacterium]